MKIMPQLCDALSLEHNDPGSQATSVKIYERCPCIILNWFGVRIISHTIEKDNGNGIRMGRLYKAREVQNDFSMENQFHLREEFDKKIKRDYKIFQGVERAL